MVEPTKKAPEIEKLIDATNPSGRKRVDSIKQDNCSWCGKSAVEFRDELSRKEYTISGFCQECQDKAFGEVGPPKEVEVVTLRHPDWGYCVMKCLRDLNSKEYAHLPMFCTVQEHGQGEPVTLRDGNGNEIRQLDWNTFKKVYVID